MLALVLLSLVFCQGSSAITSPYGWQHRRSLAGRWRFKVSPTEDQLIGFREKWWTRRLDGNVLDIPVPSSYNDITTDPSVRDYLGWAWYQTDEPVDLRGWSQYRSVIHFGGVHYYCIVWFGDKELGKHEGGHIPFEFDMGSPERAYITVAINNTLSNYTIPQGFLKEYTNKEGHSYKTYQHDFDYFDYAGINRNVFIYATSKDAYLSDLEIVTELPSNEEGHVLFSTYLNFLTKSVNCKVTLFDENIKLTSNNCTGKFIVKNPVLWWHTSSKHQPSAHLYSISVEINPNQYSNGENIYTAKFGIRTIQWDKNWLYINRERVYLKGFGKHEDSDIRGRGFDWAVTIRDFDLLNWTGANIVRTTHYPPSIEFVDMADKNGLLLIVESPACSLSAFGIEQMTRHQNILNEMFLTYRNRPSVIMWSLANEPLTNKNESESYFRSLIKLMHTLDQTRPVTFVTSQKVTYDKAVKYVDIICLNRYNGWYSFPGDLARIEDAVTEEVIAWREMYNVPVIITEYGAGTLAGLHTLPSSMWSEDYQTETLKAHFVVFDKLKESGDLAGELLWVFADFATPQEYIRPGGCIKGIFTRERQPKKAAFTIRERYKSLQFNQSVQNEFKNYASVLLV